MTILQGNKRFIESQYKSEDDFEELIRSQSKVLFGKDTMLPEEDVRSMITHNAVKHLSDPVQTFYNGHCCAVVFESAKDMDEFWNLLNILVK